MPSVDAVHGLIRLNIAEGRWPVGSRVPARRTLANALHCSQRTLQQAFKRLESEGLVSSQVRSVTLVLRQHPERFRVAVLFPIARGSSAWSRLDQGIDLLTRRRDDVVEYCSFADLTSAIGDRQRLMVELRRHTIDGVILRGEPDEHRDLLELVGGLPVTAIGVRNQRTGVPCLHLGHLQMVEAGLRRLAAHGAKRVAVISHMAFPTLNQRIGDLLHRMKIGGREQVYEVHHQHERGAQQLCELLLSLPGGIRPDGLLVGIDSLVPVVARCFADHAGLAHGIRLVVHANRPGPRQTSWPCERVGYDLEEALASATASLRSLVRGVRPPAMTNLPLVADWDAAEA